MTGDEKGHSKAPGGLFGFLLHLHVCFSGTHYTDYPYFKLLTINNSFKGCEWEKMTCWMSTGSVLSQVESVLKQKNNHAFSLADVGCFKTAQAKHWNSQFPRKETYFQNIQKKMSRKVKSFSSKTLRQSKCAEMYGVRLLISWLLCGFLIRQKGWRFAAGRQLQCRGAVTGGSVAVPVGSGRLEWLVLEMFAFPSGCCKKYAMK